MHKKKSRILCKNQFICLFSSQRCPYYFIVLLFLFSFMAKELLFISLLSKVRPGSVIFITCVFRYYHLLCEFYLFSISCFFLSSLVLNSAQLQHVSSKEIKGELCHFESVLIMICTIFVASEFIHDMSGL